MPHDPHKEFRELCALCTTGELTAEEWARLDEHLSQCPACREVQRQYDHVLGTTLPALAAQAAGERKEESAPGDWSIEDAQASLMESLRSEPQAPRVNSVVAQRSRRLKNIVMYAVAAAVLLTFGLTGYWVGMRHEREAEIAHPAPSQATHEASTSKHVQRTEESKKTSEDDQVALLQNQVWRGQEEAANSKNQLSQVEDELANRSAELDQVREERARLASELEETQANAQSLETRVIAAGNQNSADTAQLLSLQTRVGELSASLDEKDRQIAAQQELLERDQDIRNVIGARNLYIAEIYDVAKTGDTEKPFGRVFYTKDQSLIFYAYDLDQHESQKKESAFEVWGRRGADTAHDVSLGLLYREDSNKKLWVLKVNDAKTVSGLDAIFVTVEPHGGSAKPTGKPLLFTYLRLTPNHP